MNDQWKSDVPDDDASHRIAIIGMAGRFPGSPTLLRYWENLRDGLELISSPSDEALQQMGVDADLLANPDYVKAAGIIEDAAYFDAQFFQINAREAEILDPQHRLFLETAWHALEDAGIDPSRHKNTGLIGVYGGCSESLYRQENLLNNQAVSALVDRYQTILATGRDYLTTRVSYKVNLNGPSLNVQTGCSTSLVAVHLACQSLLDFQCDVALAGSVSLGVPQKFGHFYQAGMIYSPDNHCRAFDAKAQGIVGGEGVGIVVLKRLDEALTSGDHIHAVIKGSAINNDGAFKVGFTAPGIDGQAEVIALAQAAANVEPETISYIEAHGTATALGDSIEIAALRKAFQTVKDKRGYCAIGSVKTNIGHADTAAGIAGLIKTVLALQHRQLPPSLHFETPNPDLNLTDSPFYINTTLRDWPQGPTPRRAGVSSFGIGGTNAHIILEEAPPRQTTAAPQAWHVLPISAKTATALDTATHNLANHLIDNADLNPADVAFSLQTGRQHFSHRRFALCQTIADAGTVLQSLAADYVFEASLDENESVPEVVFMLSGQGSQYPNMAYDLYQSPSVFRQTVDRCAEKLESHLGFDLRTCLYPDQAKLAAAQAQLRQTDVTQPALFVVEYALAQQWQAWGVQPNAFIGHSIGEYVAACLAGVFSLDDGLALVAARGRLMQQLPNGAMLAVALSEADLEPYFAPDWSNLSLAALNTPTLSVISGLDEAVDRVQQKLAQQTITCRRLHTSHAFHSAMVEPILQLFQERVGQIPLYPPQVPFISNVTGTWIGDHEATDPAYWGRHLRHPVRFADGLSTIWQNNPAILLEVGPGQTLSTFARQHPDRPSSQWVISSLPSARETQPAPASMLKAAGQLWLAGRPIDWAALSGPQKRYRIPLPLYPFERERYWIEPVSHPTEAMPSTSAPRKKEIEQWLYVPSWQRSILPPRAPLPTAHYLIFQDQAGIGAALAEEFTTKGLQVTKVVTQPQYGKIAADIVGLHPQAAHHYEQLFAEFETLPTQIVHLWNVTTDDQIVMREESFDKYQALGFYSLLYLTQALNKRISREKIQLTVIANHSQSVTGDEPLIPAKSTALGLCKVIPQEHHDLICQHIDIVLPDAVVPNPKMLTPYLTAELSITGRQPVVAYRGRHRWIQTFEAWSTAHEPSIPALLKTKGVYMITGGLGNVGLTVADFLARTVQAKLVLIGRSPFPDKATWSDWLAQQGDDESTSQTILRIEAFEAAGAEVLVLATDVADAAAMQQAIAQTERQFGQINGVFHAAGTVEGETFRAVSQIEPDHVIEQFKAKVQGTLILEKSFRGKHLDFCLLTSSLASILGGLNFGIYAAGNAFLDAFAHYMDQISDVPWLSVNWDAWTFGKAIDQEGGLGATLAALAIKPAEGQTVLKHLLDAGLPQIAVSTADLKTRFEQWVELKQLRRQSIASQPQENVPLTKYHARPGLSTPYVAPATETEEILVEMWESLLGFESIGVQDNFFDLGGHSLLAMQVISRILVTFDIAVPINFMIDAPTVAELAKVIEASRKTAQTPQAPPLQAVERDKNLPLSFAQQRLWFLDQLEPGSHLYNLPSALRLAGPLNVDALQRSLDTIIARHEALRTIFASVDGSPVQIISSPRSIDLPLIDLGEMPAADREAAVKGLCAKEVQRPFDLTSDLMMRASLYRLEQQEHVLLLVMHHIASDLWSMGIFFKELSALYKSALQGTPSRLQELSIQYADYAVWQRRWMQGEVLETQLAFWKQQLDGMPPVLELPTDRPRLPVQSHRGASRSLALSKTISKALKALSRNEGVTLFMTLLAAFKLLLHRYTGQDDIVLGAPIAGRNRAEIEEVIGFFVGTLVLRTKVSANLTFKELLHRIQKVTLAAYANQDLPFEKLVEELQPDRDLQRNPMFQVFFNMVPVEPLALELKGLKTESVNLVEPDSIFDLTLYAIEDQSKIQLELVYNVDLFDQDRMTEMLNQLKHLLSQIVENPAKRITDYSQITEESKHLLSDPGSILPEPHQKLVTQMVAHWAEHTPDKAAVNQGQQTWTYSQLTTCAELLAQELIAYGVVKGDVIAVYGARSFGLIAAMLAALLSGGVMVPIDPSLPDQRKKQMMREAATKYMVYVGEEPPEEVWLKESAALDILYVDAEIALVIEDDKRANPAAIHLPELSADDPAYIFFTSGTTGIPNGVLGCHKGLSHFLNWQGKTFDIKASNRVAQLTNLSFDAVLRDIFLPLTHGATLCLPQEKDTLEPADILNWLEREQISVLHTVPALAQSWLDEIPVGVFLTGLRWVFFSGEPLTDTLASLWHASFPSGAMINLYGPTETTMTKCFYRVPSDVLPGVQPLGQPMPQTQALVIANNNRLCGISELGEIVIRTPFRSLGYINAPEESQQRFVKNPFRDDNMDLLYYTGDLGRYRPDGMLEILGRLDDQVKIRGVRVEPDEVTAILSRHPVVKACAVVAREDERDQPYLAGYVVTTGRDEVTTSELMSYLNRQLPTAMVPARYVFLDTLPLTPNGKVDRQALPVPDQISYGQEKLFVAPRSSLEEALAGIWIELLGQERISVHDNFFELGGHSLLATRVISQIRKVFQVELPLRSLFEAPTVAELSAAMLSISNDHEQIQKRAELLLKISQLSEDDVEKMLIKKGYTPKDREKI